MKKVNQKKNLKYQLQRGTKNLNYLMDDILYQIFKIILRKSSKDKSFTDDLSIGIYVNHVKKRITFGIKTGCYSELLTPETIELLGSTKSKLIKNKNDENVLHLEIVETVLSHCNIVNNDYQLDSRI